MAHILSVLNSYAVFGIEYHKTIIEDESRRSQKGGKRTINGSTQTIWVQEDGRCFDGQSFWVKADGLRVRLV